MAIGIFEILASIGILFLSVYYYLTSNFNYWKKRNVEGPNPILFYGNFKDVILGKTNQTLFMQELYNDFKSEPLIGVYESSNPKLIVKDLDLIKDVLIEDFNIFANRGLKIHEKVEKYCLHIFFLEHERWKPLRAKLTPIFTSGKLKDMFYLIADCANHFQKYVEVLANKSESVDCRELAAKFTTDTIGVCAFALNMNSIGDEDSEFRKFGRSLSEPSFRNKTKWLLRQFFPQLYDLVGGFVQPTAEKFFETSIKETIKYRKENNVRRNDFIDLLIDLKNHPEKIQNFSKYSNFNKVFLNRSIILLISSKIFTELTDRLLISQCFIFFLGGFETTATTIANTFYEFALNQHVQDKLRREINEEIEKSDGQLTYDCIKNMKYLDQVVKETLRKYPPVMTLTRKTVIPYTFNDTKVTIPKDMMVFIPVWSILRDSDIYPNPENYNPDRFSEENVRSRHPMAHLSFGAGPHNCIASRFAYYQTKLGIITILQKFKVQVCKNTIKEYKLVPQLAVPVPIGGIHVKLTKI